MRNHNKYNLFILVLISILITTATTSYSQQWEGDKIDAFSKEWAFNVNGGILSFFGDISSFDNDFVGKLENESGLGGGIMVTKKIFKPLGVSFQILSGNFTGRKRNIEFESSIFEYNIQASLNLLAIINSPALKNLEIQAIGGIGNFIFKTTRYEYLEGGVLISEHQARVPELVYFAGGAIQYKFSNNFSINSSLTLKQFQNDKIDIEIDNDDYDYYSYFQIGISYHLDQITRSYVKNKARVAHSTNNPNLRASRYK